MLIPQSQFRASSAPQNERHLQSHVHRLRRVRLWLLVLPSQPPERVPGRDEPRQPVPRRDEPDRQEHLSLKHGTTGELPGHSMTERRYLTAPRARPHDHSHPGGTLGNLTCSLQAGVSNPFDITRITTFRYVPLQ